MLPISATQLTDMYRKVSCKQGDHANQASQSRTLPVRDQAHRYARDIHAEVRRRSLAVSDSARGRYMEARTMTLLWVAESCSLSAN
jgi:hypothetical protein